MNEDQRLFLADAREIVEKLGRDLESLYRAREVGRRRRELAAQIFRRVHTLKGSAGSFGFPAVTRIAHEFEGVLDGARLGRVVLTDEVLNTFADALDAIVTALEGAQAAETEGFYDDVISRLNQLAKASKQQGAIAGSLRAALPSDIAQALSEYDLQHAREAIREGARLFVISAAFAIDTFDHDFRELSKLLGRAGELIATVPGAPPTADEICFRLLYAADVLTADLLRQANTLGHVTHAQLSVARAGDLDSNNPPSGPLPVPPRSDDAPVRVGGKQVDDLITVANDLFRHTSQTLSSFGNAEQRDDLTRDLRPRFLDFEERLMKLRLVPVREVFERTAARAGRVAARQLGKEVQFEIAGGDVGIESSLVDTLADPLFHLVRNAVTHGIETPEARRTAGKDPTGRVTMAAVNRSGRIHLTISDDGAGIDVDRVAETAAEQGITDSPISIDQCLRLIFRPGFSTSRGLSTLSGRGIGLDVVDRAMEIAGGQVRVATEPGAGTTFGLIVPASLSLVRCLFVRAGGETYAIDAAGAIDWDEARAADAERNLRLLHLSSLVGGDPANDDSNGPIVLWRGASAHNGPADCRLQVDEVLTRQDTLVRSLGRYAPRWTGICGAAELPDGSVALVLDLDELIRIAGEAK